MVKTVFVTRKIPEKAFTLLEERGIEVDVSSKDRILTKKELVKFLKKKPYDAVLSLLTDRIDGEVFDAVPTAKIFANYAVGFNNINLDDAKARGVTITNTPGSLTDSVAEHTFAMILAMTTRIVEGDKYIRAGKYAGWDPMLLIGTDLKNKTLGLIGAGRIGARVAYNARAFDMKVVYFDVVRNEEFEKESGASFCQTVEDVLKIADVVSLHVPLLDSTTHLINEERLKLMKPTAYLVNTARGPVIDEYALTEALKKGTIRGAALDVYEFEPKVTKGLTKLPNVILTPHIASATEVARDDMARIAAENIIDFLEGRDPKNKVE